MIQSVWVENQNGDRLDLPLSTSGEEHGIYVFNTEGLGSPVATVNGTGGPAFDGIRVNSVRADARHLMLSLAIPEGGDREEEAKALIYKHFPVKQLVTFGIVTDRVSVYTEAFIEQNEMSEFSKIENSVISMVCPEPYFLDVSEWETTVTYDSGIPLFEFPFSNESLTLPQIIFGEVTNIPTAYVYYTGAVETGATFSLYFTGNVDGLTIANSNGSQLMSIDVSVGETLAGGPIQSGDQILINTRKGEKSIYFVRAGVRYNMLASIGITDDWIQVRPGVNAIVIGATTGLEYIETDIRVRPKREGV